MGHQTHHSFEDPRIYDLVQWLAGAAEVRRHLRARAASLPAVGRVLDLGAGTGAYRDLWSSACTYVALDLDPAKLQRFAARRGGDSPLVLADAAKVPLQDHTVDVVLCTLVSHHLSDESLEEMLDEAKRVLKPSGTLVFLDAVWEPARLLGRMLWQLDAGNHARPAGRLQQLLATRFTKTDDLIFDVLHRYLLWMGKPRLPHLRLL